MIYKFEPYLKTVIWGGEKIARLKCISGAPDCVGESWEISGVDGHVSVVSEGPEKGLSLVDLIRKYKGSLLGEAIYVRHGEHFPLLVKFIDANQNLSVQVHPGERMARERHACSGKSEMWYILDSDDDSHIYAGLNREITPDEYTRLVADNTIMDVVADMKSAPGDVYFLPAGRIHAIGAGNLLAEIQQSSDITYRVYDYDRRDADGNPRELHTDLAREAIDYNVYPAYRTDYDRDSAEAVLVDCEYFNVKRLIADKQASLSLPADSFTVLVCTSGDCRIKADDGSEAVMKAFETVLIPAKVKRVEVEGTTTLLVATM